MAGEPILVVDDTPVNLKLTRILLVNEGYKVLTASSAEEALELLRGYRPLLILADVQLPGMDGLEMTRRIKQDESTRDIIVVALTAFAMKGDEQKAIDAGCDGYITKPIDTRTLGQRIRTLIDSRGDAQQPAAVPVPAGEGGETEHVSGAELAALRRRFLEEGQERSRQLLLDLDGEFNPYNAGRAVHQWIGTGGLLGYSAISRLAREVEGVLQERPIDAAQLRETLTNLVLAFTSPREARDTAVPETIIKSLTGKVIAVAGLPANETQRLCAALERVDARPAFFDLDKPPEPVSLAGCDLAVVYVRSDGSGAAWLDPASAVSRLPVVLVGVRDHLLGLDPAVQALAREFLMDSWQPDEALVRLSLAISWAPGERPAAQALPASPVARPRVVIADDDSTVLTLVRMTLENFGMQCEQAVDGRSAIEAVRKFQPHAVVLDVNMPGMDGYEVLAAIRGENMNTRVLLLTARQQENDVIRGFSLGADDYVVKPFSPMELVARLKRLLAR
ncbi:MAG: response regulator [Acidobacteria bacterium]|nr:response regulator [Acidobacteriota bacterium]